MAAKRKADVTKEPEVDVPSLLPRLPHHSPDRSFTVSYLLDVITVFTLTLIVRDGWTGCLTVASMTSDGSCYTRRFPLSLDLEWVSILGLGAVLSGGPGLAQEGFNLRFV